MFGQIITLLSLIGCIGLNVPFNVEKTIKYDEVVTTESIKQRNYQRIDWLNSLTEVTYKYDTNEVNGDPNNLVVGNIYKFDLTGVNFDSSIRFIHLSEAIFSRVGFNNDMTIQSDTNGYIEVITQTNQTISFLMYNSDIVEYYSVACFEKVFYGVYQYHDDRLGDFVNYIFPTDYNVIESVTYHEPQTVVGVINEFCETYLFKDIPFVNSMTFEIGGQSINLMTWLVMLVGIALSIGILILLFVVFKWLFLLFAAIFKR